MGELLEVELVANHDADHCFQACLKMMLGYTDPERTYSWEELDVISGKTEGYWTWPMASWVWAQRQGLDVMVVANFDYGRFAEEGEDYLIECNGKETAAKQIARSNIAQERRFAAVAAREVAIENRDPTIEDIQQAIGRRALACCTVNANRLNDRPGFAGHFVVVTGIADNTLFFNDPGGPLTPARKNREMPIHTFSAAWGSMFTLSTASVSF